MWKPFRLPRLPLLALLVSAAQAFGMSVEDTNFDRLLQQSQQIYKARVVSVECDWSGEGANRHIATFVRLRVLESYLGRAEGEQVLEFFGGTIGQQSERIAGMPQFRPGDVDILFVRGNHTDLCPLVGLHFGRLRVIQNAANGREQVFLYNGTPLTDVSLIGKEHGSPLSVGQSFRDARSPITGKEMASQIRAGLRGRGIAPDEK